MLPTVEKRDVAVTPGIKAGVAFVVFAGIAHAQRKSEILTQRRREKAEYIFVNIIYSGN